VWRAKVEGKPQTAINGFFSVFEAFSFLLDDGNRLSVASQQTMKALQHSAKKMNTNDREHRIPRKND
jgi:hypothetical protein